ncbi:MAG: sensor domain-containing phosphodiesterase [Minwuia sp.]|nr:sensor domain-containing phosphodiesterase [Minwuia sp.]
MDTAFAENTTAALERERLAALRKMNLIDSPRDSDLDQLINHLIKTLNFPIGYISLIDEDRQWFKSMHGLDVQETPRDISFCTHTIRDEVPMVVENALLDERFSDNPLVTGEPHLRAYAGTPVRTLDGHRIGTICVADTQPRSIDEDQTATLCRFASLVERLFANVEYGIRASEEQALIDTVRSEQQHLLQNVDRLETNLAVGHWELDLVTDKLTWSKGVFSLHGIAADREPTLEEALSFYPVPERERIIASLKRATESGRSFDITAHFIDARQDTRQVRVRGEKIVPESGNPRLAGIFQDITDRQETQNQLNAAMENDPVTRVRNSQSFEKLLANWVGDGERDAFTLITIGVPEIMTVRKSLGMSLTDMMLREMADALQSQLEDGEILARTSFEAFSLLTDQNIGPDMLRDRVTGILQLLNLKVTVLRRRLDIEPQGAIAQFPSDGQMPVDLLRAADLAFHAACDDPDAGVALFDATMLDRFEVRENASGFLQDAIDEGRVVAYFQPIIRLSDGHLAAFEALIRIRLADGSIAGPADFWPALMDAHIARRVGFIMRDTIIDQLAQWQTAGLDVPRVSLNATTSDLSSGGMYDDLLQALAARNVSPSLLKVEVTENVLLDDHKSRVDSNIATLREHGIGISLDDFGTGYASLTNLMSLPTDEVKIDHIFVRSIGKDKDSHAITSSILEMATKMGIDTVSEGIETADQLNFVRTHGSTHGQGFLLGRPMPAADATELVKVGSVDIAALMHARES